VSKDSECRPCRKSMIQNTKYTRKCIKPNCKGGDNGFRNFLNDKGECAPCPEYQRKDPLNQEKCKEPTCASKQKVGHSGMCEDCTTNDKYGKYKVQNPSNSKECTHPTTCKLNQYIGKDAMCKNCPSYQVTPDNPE